MESWKKIVRAFRVGCPILALETSDPANSLRGICRTFSDEIKGEPVAVIVWDCVRGLSALPADCGLSAKAGADSLTIIENPEELTHPTSALTQLGRLRSRIVVVMVNVHMFIDEPSVKQAIWNLRDDFKASNKTLILSGPVVSIPMELTHDVIQIVEPLPQEEQLRKIVSEVVASASASYPNIKTSKEDIDDAGNAALGVTAFAAENLASFAITKDGLSVSDVWQSKRAKINQTPGLRMIDSGKLADIGGCTQIKKFLSGILNGKDAPNAIVFIDEIEKSIGGSSGDTSGVSQDQLGQLLSWMQDNAASGCIFVGPPGAAKSAIAKASGSESGIPTIQLDLGGAKGSLVGESEAKIRDALKVVHAVSGGKTLWLATCNSLTSLPPELRRRFKLGQWFFDLPDENERKAIWAIYAKKFKRSKAEYESMIATEWTGAEIESCCEIANRINSTLQEASEYIVPIAKSSSEAIASLRQGAEGRLLDASNPGVYTRIRKAGSNKRTFE